MTDIDPPMVVTSTPTISNGTVLKWWLAQGARTGEPGVQPEMSASRHGVLVNTYLHIIPAAALDQAHEAHRLLAAGDAVAASRIVTHQYDRGEMRLVQVTR